MKPIVIVEQIDNRSVGIFQESNGTFTAMTLTQSKSGYKSVKAAAKWLSKFGYVVEVK